MLLAFRSGDLPVAVLATFSYWAFSYDHPSYFIVSCTQSKISIRKSKFPASIAGQAPANSVRIRSIEIQFALHSIRVLNRTTRTRNHSRSPLTTIIAARGCRRSCTASRLTPTVAAHRHAFSGLRKSLSACLSLSARAIRTSQVVGRLPACRTV